MGEAELFGACTEECTRQKHLESFYILETKCLSFKSLVTFEDKGCVLGNVYVPKGKQKPALNCTKCFTQSLKISFNSSCFLLFSPQAKMSNFLPTCSPAHQLQPLSTPQPPYPRSGRFRTADAPSFSSLPREHPRGCGVTPSHAALEPPRPLDAHRTRQPPDRRPRALCHTLLLHEGTHGGFALPEPGGRRSGWPRPRHRRRGAPAPRAPTSAPTSARPWGSRSCSPGRASRRPAAAPAPPPPSPRR